MMEAESTAMTAALLLLIVCSEVTELTITAVQSVLGAKESKLATVYLKITQLDAAEG
jgi:hypothetical protein